MHCQQALQQSTIIILFEVWYKILLTGSSQNSEMNKWKSVTIVPATASSFKYEKSQDGSSAIGLSHW